MKTLLLVALLSILAGCVTAGREVDPVKVSAFEKGKTSRAEIEAAIGQPNSVSRLSDGKVVAVYFFMHSQSRPESFIPFIGPLVGGSDVVQKNVIIYYGTTGLYESSQSTETTMGAAIGLAGGQYRPRTNQPQELPQ